MKTCTKCGETKVVGLFPKGKRYKNGVRSQCKACVSSRVMVAYWKNPEKFRARSLEGSKKYWSANKDELNERRRQTRLENPELQREKDRRCIERASPEAKQNRISCSQKWTKENPENRAAASKRYRLKNVAYYRAHVRTRQARKLGSTPIWADLEKIKAFYAEARRLELKTGQKHHVDHIVPLKSEIVCGLHCEANLQVIPAFENYSKNNRAWPDMP